jgi:hypothetical protein
MYHQKEHYYTKGILSCLTAEEMRKREVENRNPERKKGNEEALGGRKQKMLACR